MKHSAPLVQGKVVYEIIHIAGLEGLWGLKSCWQIYTQSVIYSFITQHFAELSMTWWRKSQDRAGWRAVIECLPQRTGNRVMTQLPIRRSQSAHMQFTS